MWSTSPRTAPRTVHRPSSRHPTRPNDTWLRGRGPHTASHEPAAHGDLRASSREMAKRMPTRERTGEAEPLRPLIAGITHSGEVPPGGARLPVRPLMPGSFVSGTGSGSGVEVHGPLEDALANRFRRKFEALGIFDALPFPTTSTRGSLPIARWLRRPCFTTTLKAAHSSSTAT